MINYNSYISKIEEAKRVGNERLAWSLMCEAECEKAIELRGLDGYDLDRIERLHQEHREFLRKVGY